MSGVIGVPEGITNPPIDELLSKVDSKYALGPVLGQAGPTDQRVLLPAR